MTKKQLLQKIVADPILWIETFVRIVDKRGKLVPFKLNPQQRYIMKNGSSGIVVGQKLA